MSQCCGSALAVHNIVPDSIRENARSVNPGQPGGRAVSAYCQGPVPASLSGRDALAAIADFNAVGLSRLSSHGRDVDELIMLKCGRDGFVHTSPP